MTQDFKIYFFNSSRKQNTFIINNQEHFDNFKYFSAVCNVLIYFNVEWENKSEKVMTQ